MGKTMKSEQPNLLTTKTQPKRCCKTHQEIPGTPLNQLDYLISKLCQSSLSQFSKTRKFLAACFATFVVVPSLPFFPVVPLAAQSKSYK